MKKINILKLLAAFVFLCFFESSQALAVAQVQVSDLGAERFVKECNYYLSQERSERIVLDGKIYSGDTFDHWGGGVPEKRVAIIFYVNKSGYVSMIEIYSAHNSTSLNMAGSVLASCLGTIGLTNKEVQTLFSQSGDVLSVWGSRINRRVAVHTYNDDKVNCKCTRIAAFD